MNCRGRIAPTPNGFLHVGHAYTFGIAAKRAAGELVFRVDDLDTARCLDEYTEAAIEDLRWLGLVWAEGPDCGGRTGPYFQSQRTSLYQRAWQRLAATGAIYPSPHSRRDVNEAALAPHAPVIGEGLFPVALRPNDWKVPACPDRTPWRFRVPDGRKVEFIDQNVGLVKQTAGIDFGDFVVWRRDNLAAYELAVVVDDHYMEIEEVVRGKDLLPSTARQILLYEALGWKPPQYFHTNLIVGPDSKRLAKRTNGLMIRELRNEGFSSETVLSGSVKGTFSK